MANYIDSFDLNQTRVPIYFPLAATCVFEAVQLHLGSDPFIVLMSMAAIVIPFLPLHFYGRDLYSMFSVLFSFKYVLAALIAKTLYGQPLQSNLYDPYISHALVLLLMIITTTVLMIARKFDRGKTLFPFPTDAASLRRLAIISFSFGFGAMVVVGSKHDPGAGFSAGPLMIIAATVGGLCFLGVIAEAAHNVQRSEGKSLLSPLLLGMLFLILAIVMALNMRTYFATAVISVGLVAIIYKVIRIKYIVVCALVAFFFLTFLSPLTLYLRAHRDMPVGDFIGFTMQTAGRMAVDSTFRKNVQDNAKFSSLQNIEDNPDYDYFGDRSNVANRIAFIGLLDAVYENSKRVAPLGMEAVKQSIGTNLPTFMGFTKNPYSPADWMNWQMGMELPDQGGYYNFGLPMEGLATWGMIGFITYPFIFLLPVFVLFGRIASFRVPLPLSIYLFGDLQNAILESTSDGFINTIIRGAPIACGVLFGLYWVFFRRAASHGHSLRSALEQG